MTPTKKPKRERVIWLEEWANDFTDWAPTGCEPFKTREEGRHHMSKDHILGFRYRLVQYVRRGGK